MDSYIDIIKVGLGDDLFQHLIWYCALVVVCIVVSGLFSVADAGSGVYTAWKLNEPICSHLLRKTIEKMLVYWFFQILVAIVGFIVFLVAPEYYNLPYMSIVLAVVLCIIELWSMWENHRRIKNGHIAKVSESIEDALDRLIETAGGAEEVKRLLRKKLGTEGGEPGA